MKNFFQLEPEDVTVYGMYAMTTNGEVLVSRWLACKACSKYMTTPIYLKGHEADLIETIDEPKCPFCLGELYLTDGTGIAD